MTEWFLKRSSWRSVSEMKISPGPLWPSAMSSSKPERLSEKRKKKWKMLKTNEERGLIFEIRDNLRKKISMCNNKKREEKKTEFYSTMCARENLLLNTMGSIRFQSLS